MKYIAIVALFASQAEAIQYRPTNAQAPWYKEQSTGETWMDPKWPVNYSVPNFGKDHEIVSTQDAISKTEELMGKKINASFDEPKAPPRGYVVPNFGKDVDMINAESAIASSEATLGTTWTPVADANGYFNVPEAFSADSYSYDAANAANLVGNRYVQQ